MPTSSPYNPPLPSPSSSPLKPSTQNFYNAYEPTINLYERSPVKKLSNEVKSGYLISEAQEFVCNNAPNTQNTPNELSRTDDQYIDVVNKEIEDNLKFIKEAVSKNKISERYNEHSRESPPMKTFGSKLKEDALQSDVFPPPPSYFFDKSTDSSNEAIKLNDEAVCPPTPPPPPPPKTPPPLPRYSSPHIIAKRETPIGTLLNNSDQSRSSYTDTYSEKSEVSDLDLSMLPLDAKSWSHRLERKCIPKIRSNESPIGTHFVSTKAAQTRKPNYENHDIKAVRIAPDVTQIQYSGKSMVVIK